MKNLIIMHFFGHLAANWQFYIAIGLSVLYGIASDLLPYVKKGPQWLQKADSVILGQRNVIACILGKEGIPMPPDKPEQGDTGITGIGLPPSGPAASGQPTS